MKIALVHMRYSWTGGTERYLAQLATHLAEERDEVTVICRSKKGDAHPAVRFEYLRDFALGGGWRLWAFANAVERHVRASDYDVVYGLGKTWTHDVVRLGGGCHRTYLERAHKATLTPLERAAGKGQMKHALALRIEARALAPDAYKRVVTNSAMVKRDVCARYKVPEDAVSVVYNGVDLERFDRERHRERAAELRRELGFAADDSVVLFLGTGYGRKGLSRVLKAFPEVVGAHPKARLLVVGFDSEKKRYERRAQDLKLGDAVRFVGGRRDTEVCYAASDLYVLPTLYDPFANTTLEALASGLPVVTTASNGAAELIEPDVHGTVLDERPSPDAIANAVNHWVSGGDRTDAASRCRELAGRFSQERTVAASTEVLRDVATVLGRGERLQHRS